MLFEPTANLVEQLNALVQDADVGPPEVPAGPWNGAKCGLFKFGYEPNTGMTFAEVDAQKCDFSGYAISAALEFGAAFTDDSGVAHIAAGSVQFTRGAGATSNDAGGYYVVNGAGDQILFAEKFPEAVPMDVVGKALIVLPKYQRSRKTA